MRAVEFMEADNEQGLKFAFIDVLISLINQTDQIRVDSLIKIMRRQPGAEYFNFDTLKNLIDNDSQIKNMVSGIESDDFNVKYLKFKSLPTIDGPDIKNNTGQSKDKNADTDTNSDTVSKKPKQIVKKMAKRAAMK